MLPLQSQRQGLLQTQFFYSSSRNRYNREKDRPKKRWKSKKKNGFLKANEEAEIIEVPADNTLSVAAEKVLQEDRGYYFEAYSSLQSHEMMIRDHVRTSAYRRAIELNRHLFQDKIVLDVGCGLGILSLFAAMAGAKKVIGVDASDITVFAEKVVRRNKLDNITIVQSKVEELERLPDGVEHVDVIISEWMGVCLYHESMLGTVLYARDKWLKEGGLLFPDRAHFYLACIDDTKRESNAFDKWSSVQGFNLARLLDITFSEPLQEIIAAKQVVTNCELIHILDLHAATSDYPFVAEFSLKVQRSCSIGGFVAFFDTLFSQCHKPVVLSTSPFTEPTHWRQTSFYLREPILAHTGDHVTGTFDLRQFAHNFRDLEIRINGYHSSAQSGRRFDTKFILR